MSDELNLDELERLEKAMTPGPWETRTIYGYLPKDSVLIVAVRNALPALLAKVREQAARIAELERAIGNGNYLTDTQKLELNAEHIALLNKRIAELEAEQIKSKRTAPPNLELARKLRERSGAPLLDCVLALAKSGEDEDTAYEILFRKGMCAGSKGAVRLTVEQARKLEWCASYWHCPACEAPRRSPLHVGAEAPHKGDCWLAAAIKAAQGE